MRHFVSFAAILALCCAGCGPSTPAPEPKPGPDGAGRYLGRRIAPLLPVGESDALVRPERARDERVDLLYQALGLNPGKTACDVGAGNGYHTLELAKQVYPGGHVVAVDIQPGMLDRLAAREKVTRAEGGAMVPIDRVVGTATEAGLPEGGCDLVLVVDAYHEFSDPRAMLASIRSALKLDGRLAIVEPRAEDPKLAALKRRKMSKAQLHREVASNGFVLIGQLDALPRQHALFYGRDDGPRGAVNLREWRPRGGGDEATTAPIDDGGERANDSGDVE